MPAVNLSTVLRHMRVLSEAQSARDLSDGELLERFRTKHEETALALLVQRHGPMVLGVCRRLLDDVHASEDAFQATFLVLVRKARAIRKQDSVASWLHGVARRVAMKARVRAARMSALERQYTAMQRPQARDDGSWQEVREILDEELDALPEKYRRPLILCELEGKTHQEAARELHCPRTSVSTRLSRARALLRQRLVRRGITISTAALGALLTENASAAVPALLTIATVRVATAKAPAGISASVALLAEEGLKSMGIAKMSVVLSLVLATCLAAAGTVMVAAPSANPGRSIGEQDGADVGDRNRPKSTEQPKVDRFGDPLPRGAIVRLGTTRLRHGSSVHALVYSPDGKLIASGADDYTVRLSDAATGREVRRFPKQGGCTFALAFSADSKRLAGGNLGGEITVWDVATGKVVRQFERQDCSVKSIAFLPGDKQLVSGGSDGVLQVWDIATGKRVWNYVHEQTGITSVAVAAEGRLVASATRDDTARTWDAVTGKQSRQFPFARLECVALSPDGRTLAAGGSSSEVILWNTATGRGLRRLTDEKLSVGHLTYSRDGKLLASANGGSGLIVIWDAETGKTVTRLRSDHTSVAVVAFAPDGKTIATGGDDQIIRQWDVATGKEIRPLGGPEGAVRAVAFSPDGKTLATAGSDLMVRLWDVATWKELRRLQAEHPWHILAIAFSADGTMLATAGGAGAVDVWETRNGKQLHELKVETSWTYGVAFAPDGKTLAAARGNGKLDLWDIATGKRLHQWDMAKEARAVAFSPDGKLLAASGDGTIHLWSTTTRETIRQWKSDDRGAEKLAFSPDGRLLVSCEYDQFVKLWDYTTGSEIARFKEATQRVSSFAFSPDSATLAVHGAGNTIALWDVAQRKQISRLAGHDCTFHSALAFSRDGRMLASGTDDTTVVVWDITGKTASPAARAALTAPELEKHWANMASVDDSHVSRSLFELVAAGKQSVTYIKKRLPPASTGTAEQEKEIAQEIAELDNETFETRETAMRRLEKRGDTALPALIKAQKNSTSPEARRRAGRLISRIEEASRQDLRAVELLERIGTPDARDVLKALAEGAPVAPLTREARAALERLARRTAP